MRHLISADNGIKIGKNAYFLQIAFYRFPLGAACNGDFYTALLEILQNLPNARLFRYVRLKLAFHAQNTIIRKCLCVYLRIIL